MAESLDRLQIVQRFTDPHDEGVTVLQASNSEANGPVGSTVIQLRGGWIASNRKPSIAKPRAAATEQV